MISHRYNVWVCRRMFVISSLRFYYSTSIKIIVCSLISLVTITFIICAYLCVCCRSIVSISIYVVRSFCLTYCPKIILFCVWTFITISLIYLSRITFLSVNLPFVPTNPWVSSSRNWMMLTMYSMCGFIIIAFCYCCVSCVFITEPIIFIAYVLIICALFNL